MPDLFANNDNFLIYGSSKQDGINKLAGDYLDSFVSTYSGNPNEEKAKIVGANIISNISNTPFKEVYGNYDTYIKQYTGKDISYTSGLEAIKGAFNRSVLEMQKGGKYFQYMFFPENKELLDDIKKIDEQISSDVQWEDYGLLTDSFVSAANILPQIGRSLAAGGIGGVVGGGVGFLAGGPAGAAAGFNIGAKVGASAGLGLMATQEAGGAFEEIMQYTDESGNQVPLDVARGISLGVGGVNMLLERWQLKSFPGVMDVFNRYAGKATRKAIAGGLLKEVATKWSKGVVENSLQEAMQETVTILGVEMAKLAAGEEPGFNEDKFMDNLKRVTEVFLDSVKGFAVLGGVGASVGTSLSYAQNAPTIQQLNEIEKNFDLSPRSMPAKVENVISGETQKTQEAPRAETAEKEETRETINRAPVKGVILPDGKFKILEGERERFNKLKADGVTDIAVEPVDVSVIDTQTPEERRAQHEQSQSEIKEAVESIALVDDAKIESWVNDEGRSVNRIVYPDGEVIGKSLDEIMKNHDVWGVYTVNGVQLDKSPVITLIVKTDKGAYTELQLTTQEHQNAITQSGVRSAQKAITEFGEIIDTVDEEEAKDQLEAILSNFNNAVRKASEANPTKDTLDKEVSSIKNEFNSILDEFESVGNYDINTITAELRKKIESGDQATEKKATLSDQAVQREKETWEKNPEDIVNEYQQKVRNDFREKIVEAMPKLSDEEVEIVTVIVEQIAVYRQMDLEDFLKEMFDGKIFGELPPELVRGGFARAGIVTKDGKSIILLTESSDVTSLIHEFAHLLHNNLTDEHLSIFEEAYGIEEGRWRLPIRKDGGKFIVTFKGSDYDFTDLPAAQNFANRHEEKFVRDFEIYLKEGKTSNEKINTILAKLKDVLIKLYRHIKGYTTKYIKDDVIKAFDEILSAQGEDVSPIRFQTLPEQRKIPETGTYPALRTDDGGIYFDDKDYGTHVRFIQGEGIPIERITSGGWLVDGIYEASYRSDTMDYVNRQKARIRADEKRNARIDSTRFQTTPTYYITPAKKKKILKESAEGVKEAVENQYPVPDDILAEYSDYEWAAEEIERRRVINEDMPWLVDLVVNSETLEDLKLATEMSFFTMDDQQREQVKSIDDEFYKYLWNYIKYQDPVTAEQQFLEEYGTPEGVEGLLGQMNGIPQKFKGSAIPKRMWFLANKRKHTPEDLEIAAKMVRNDPLTYRWAVAKADDDVDAQRQLYHEEKVRSLDSMINPIDVTALPQDEQAKILAETSDPVLREMILDGVGSESMLDSLDKEYRKSIALMKRRSTMTEKELAESVKQSNRVASNLRTKLSDVEQELKSVNKELKSTENKLEKARESRDRNARKVIAANALRDAELRQQKRKLQERYYEMKLKLELAMADLKEAQREKVKSVKEDEREKANKKIVELKEAQKIKDYTRKIREEKKRIVKQIVRTPAKSAAFEYKRLIESLQELVDPNFRGKRNTQAWLESRNKITDPMITSFFPAGFDLFAKKPLNEWTLDDLRVLHELIRELRRVGRQLSLDRDYKRKSELLKIVQDFNENNTVGRSAIFGEGSVEQMRHDKGTIKDFTRIQTARPSRMFRILDGYREGGMYKFIWEGLNRQYNEYLRERKRRLTAGNEMLKSLGIKGDELMKKITVRGVDTETNKEIDYTYTVDDIIYLYVSQFNEYSRAAVIDGNNISEATLQRLVGQLDPKFIEWGKWMLNEFENEYSRLRQAHLEYTNEELGKQSNYFTIIRADYEEKGQEDLLKFRSGLQKAYAERGMTKERIKISKEHQGRVRLGATSIWRKQIDRQEHYINNAQFIKDTNWVLDQGGLKAAVRQKYGEGYAKWLQTYINNYANPQFFRDDLHYIASRFRKNMAMGYLGLNFLTVLKQTASFSHFLRAMGPHRLLAAVAKFGANPAKWWKFIEEMSPQMHERRAYQVMRDIQASKSKTKAGQLIDKIGTLSMKPIGFMDNLVVSILWLGAFDKYKHQMSVDKASEKATEFIMETQPASSTKDLPQIYRKENASVWKFLLMFSNQLNQNWNSLVFDTTYQFKNRNFGELATTVVSVAMSTVAISLISGFEIPEDEPLDDILEEFAIQALNMLPIVGGEVGRGLSGWNYSSGSALDMFSDIGSFAKLISDGDDIDKVVNKLIDVGENMLIYGVGAPVTGARRIINSVKEQDIAEILGSGWTD